MTSLLSFSIPVSNSFFFFPKLQAEHHRKLYNRDTRFYCYEDCMQRNRKCRRCDLRRKSMLFTKIAGRAYCEGGVLPSRCQKCCPYKDTGCYCDKACMSSRTCTRYCPKMNNIGRTYCTDLGWGWNNVPERAFVPCVCEHCCPGCENVRCPVN